MIIIRDALLMFNTRTLFDTINCTLQAGQKIGVVGKNGAGKSTLLKAIAGQQALDGGQISIERGKKIAYLPQDVVMLSSKNILEEALSVFDEVFATKAELEKLEIVLGEQGSAADPVVVERYAHLASEYAQMDSGSLEVKTKRVLQGLGIGPNVWVKRVDQLSVGWKMRLVLAKLLLQEADFYLFDEPTNHLDIVAKDWFLGFLQASKIGFLLVSHDRYFLDHACTNIIELENGHLTEYYGNYTTYIEQKEEAQLVKEKAYELQQKDIKRRMDTINRFRAKASKASMAQSMLKSLDKMERIEIDRKQTNLSFSFAPVQRAGDIVLTMENIGKSFGENKLFSGASGEIKREEKVALVAANGVGKTTLLSIIMGKLAPDVGTVTFGYNVTSALFEQDQERSLNPEKTIVEEADDACTTSQARGSVRSLLGTFLFPGDDAYKRIKVLSGGEKNRVAMVKVLLANANFLILDEPTNHLDLQSKEILLHALQQFKGTILFVSHDRDFLDALATRILELTPTGLRSYKGNYESYLYQKNQQALTAGPGIAAGQPKQAVVHNAQPPKDESAKAAKEQYEQRKKRNALESKIAKLEKEVANLQDNLGNFAWGSAPHQQAEQQLSTAKGKLALAYAEWEGLAA